MTYRAIRWWQDAYHVFSSGKRIGIVNRRVMRTKGQECEVWFAHNYNFCGVRGEFKTRTAAAEAIPKGAIHQPIEAFS